MSMKMYAYMMAGVTMRRDDFPGDLWGDKWLPFVEGHQGVDMRILWGESEFIHIGKVYGSVGPYDGDVHVTATNTEADLAMVDAWLRDNLQWTGQSAAIMLCTVWM